MLPPPTPANESERLRELDTYNILETLPEKDYDDLTRLAAQLCGTPISLVSLVDDHRQWFKSRHGLKATQTPKEHAFCAHAINDPDSLFVIEDARKDARFQNNPLVTGDPNIIFYAGMPLVSENGLPLGTLCVIDNKPSQLTEEQIESLKSLSRQVMNLLELHKKKQELEAVVRELETRNGELEQFAQVAAHDLKSPLNNISMLTDILQKDFGPSLGDEGNDLLGMLGRSSVKLKNMVDGLLEYTRSDRHSQDQQEKISLHELTHEIRDLLVLKNEAIVDLETELITIYSNKVALLQVLVNLVGNAIKYNDQPIPKISIRVEEDSKYYSFTVADNGPGIPEAIREKVFDIFQVGHSKDRYGKRGTGIGLATVKKIVEAMGGDITLLSAPGKGATFRFTFVKPIAYYDALTA